MDFWRLPLDTDDIQITKGIVHILEDRCKGCGYCIEYCPRQVLDFSSKFNKKGYHPPVVVAPDKCTFDGLCENICPDSAIFIVRKEAKIETE